MPFARRHESGLWEDEHGALGPSKPGRGPRTDRPAGPAPGPAVGDRFPDVVATTHDGRRLDVHADRGDRAAIFVFYRSAVW